MRLSAAELRARRVRLGMSQRQLAAELGVTETTVARWERGERRISNSVLVLLALDQLASRAVRPGHAIGVPPLPAPAAELIGRDRELDSLSSLLAKPEVRLVTLTGPGGAGKTVLALAALKTAATRRVSGASLAELADLPPSSPEDAIWAALADSLGVRERDGEPLADAVVQALRPADTLLLVDNCEHVTAASADLIAKLIENCPKVTVLATSREPLRLRAERRFPVPPLRVPDLTSLPAPAALARIPAVHLFITRWSAVNPGFRLTASQARSVAEICVRLDGLPLAVELAAAQGHQPSPAAVLAHLDALPDFPGRGHRDRPHRHRSLRTILDWSYRLLDPPVQSLFRHLGVFAGGFDAKAATEVCAAPRGQVSDVSQGIEVLIDASLVTRYQTPAGAQRMRLLETVRGYAIERLAAAGELDAMARRHAGWLVRWTESNAVKFENSAQLDWLDELDAEIANLRAALTWSRSASGDPDLGLRLAAAMRRYWDMRGLPSEAREQLGHLLATASAEPSAARLYAHIELSGLAVSQEDTVTIEQHAREARRIADALGDLRGASNACELLVYASFLRGDRPGAKALARESLAHAIRAGHPLAKAHASLASGVAALGSGELDAAAANLERALDHGRDQGDRWFTGECASVLAHVQLARGDFLAARAAEAESLAASVALKNRPAIAVHLKIIGIADAATGATARAAVLFGGAAAIEENFTPTWQQHWLDAYRAAVASAQQALGDQFTALLEFGRARTETEIVRIALLARNAPPAPVSSTPLAQSGVLTPRERQVSELITEGRTSEQIADLLGISRRTVDTHAEHIMTKLGVRTRVQVAAWVERNR